MRLPLVLCAGLLATPLARAEGSTSGFELGLRGMFQTPFGSQSGADMSIRYSPGFAFELEVGARFAGARVSLLGFFGTGPVWIQDIRQPPLAPGQAPLYPVAMDTRFGVELLLRPFSSVAIQPWGGIGVGAELLNGDWGILFTPQVGVDLRISTLGIGPYIEVPFGTFFRGPATTAGGGDFHGWFTAGLRLSFAPRPS